MSAQNLARQAMAETITEQTRAKLKNKSFELFVINDKLDELRATIEIKTTSTSVKSKTLSSAAKSETSKSLTRTIFFSSFLLIFVTL